MGMLLWAMVVIASVGAGSAAGAEQESALQKLQALAGPQVAQAPPSVPKQPVEPAQRSTGTVEAGKLLAKYECMACHGITTQIGPDFRAVAARYKDDPQSREIIARQVIQGGGGKWGKTTMPGYKQEIPAAEIKILADWILSQL